MVSFCSGCRPGEPGFQEPFNINKVLMGSTSSLQNILARVQAAIGTDKSQQPGLVSLSRAAPQIRAEISRREQNKIINVSNKAFERLSSDFFGKFNEAVESQDFKLTQIQEASTAFDLQLGNFQREQVDIERGIITSQSQVNMGSQNNLLLIAGVIGAVFLLG